MTLSAAMLLAVSCTKDPIREIRKDPVDTVKVPAYDNGIFIINEGNFNWGNASVTYIDNQSQSVVQDVFGKANARNLGDVAESMTIVGNKGYLLINNSNRIEVVGLKDFKSVKVITGLHSPRFMFIVDSTKAYATNLQNYISVIDLQTNMVSATIPTTSWTENMIRYGKYVLVTSIGKFSEPSSERIAQILVVDTGTDQIVDSIQSGKEPIGLVIDKKEKVWVLCSGGYDHYEPPTLMRINPELREVEKTFTFSDLNAVPSRLCINPGGDTLYFLNRGLFRMPVASTALPEAPLVPENGRHFYGLSIHPVTGNVFITDARDYVQDGSAFQFDRHGKLIREYPAGRIPGSFCFTSVPGK